MAPPLSRWLAGPDSPYSGLSTPDQSAAWAALSFHANVLRNCGMGIAQVWSDKGGWLTVKRVLKCRLLATVVTIPSRDHLIPENTNDGARNAILVIALLFVSS
ncbi:hypothetical protein KCP75_20415 [Salmonella enterica subsp. enterica]|nr:hypothetical protein KCP75_20415 [Salmonella enterica subsp. enterica]